MALPLCVCLCVGSDGFYIGAPGYFKLGTRAAVPYRLKLMEEKTRKTNDIDMYELLEEEREGPCAEDEQQQAFEART